MEDKGGIVFGQRDVLTTQCSHMGAYGQSQKVERVLTFLRIRAERNKDSEDDKNTFFHLKNLNFSAKLKNNCEL
jgi:hypothetical protein